MTIRTITTTAISSGICRRGTAGAGCGLISAADAGQAIADHVLSEQVFGVACIEAGGKGETLGVGGDGSGGAGSAPAQNRPPGDGGGVGRFIPAAGRSWWFAGWMAGFLVAAPGAPEPRPVSAPPA